MRRKTLRELATELNLSHKIFPSGQIGQDILEISPRFGIVEKGGKIKLIDLVSLARFNPITIGRQTGITIAGYNVLMTQLKQYRKQKGLSEFA